MFGTCFVGRQVSNGKREREGRGRGVEQLGAVYTIRLGARKKVKVECAAAARITDLPRPQILFFLFFFSSKHLATTDDENI